MLKRFMHFLFLSCVKATELIEKKIHFKLSFSEKLQLKMHKSLCEACTQYEKQSILIDKNILAHQEQTPSQMDIEMLKKRISDKLENSAK
jgi:hypothetical protein